MHTKKTAPYFRGQARSVRSRARRRRPASAAGRQASALFRVERRHRVQDGPMWKRTPRPSAHASMSGSRCPSAWRRSVVVSATRRGTIAEATPEFHRPSRRSLVSASTTEAPALMWGSRPRNSVRGGSLRRGRATPSRSSRDSLPRPAHPARSPVTGSSRATGRPRSTMSTGEPALEASISALRLFLASVMLAIFIGLEWAVTAGYSSLQHPKTGRRRHHLAKSRGALLRSRRTTALMVARLLAPEYGARGTFDLAAHAPRRPPLRPTSAGRVTILHKDQSMLDYKIIGMAE